MTYTTIPTELAEGIIFLVRKLQEEVESAGIALSDLDHYYPLYFFIKDLETLASCAIPIGSKEKKSFSLRSLDEQNAEWRRTSHPNRMIDRIVIGFNVEAREPITLSISKVSARHLVETLARHLRRTQPRMSSGIPSLDVLSPSVP